jgi:hypothetical protein
MKKLKVFSLPWHVANQFEMLKLPFEWHYLIQHTRKWSNEARPLPEHVKWVTHFDEDEHYDLAILHIDQQCLLDDLGKSKLFKDVYSVVKGKVPVIVVNHGTPVYPERFMQMAEEEYKRPVTEKEGEEWCVKKINELLDGVSEVVVNSHQAQKMWGRGVAIIHGMDANEWFDLPKEPRVATFISPSGIGNKYYGRTLFEETRDVLKTKYGIELVWIGQEASFKSWTEYRNFIGKTLVYFNPTLESPMPRSRTEAMLSGCCVVTTKYHDADSFIKHGVNGFICKENPEDAAKIIADLIFNYKKAVAIGQEGKKTAQELFNGERFRADWINVIEKVLNKKII